MHEFLEHDVATFGRVYPPVRRVTEEVICRLRSAGFCSNVNPERDAMAAVLVAAGYLNESIAEWLKIPEGTVKSLLNRMFRRLGVENRVGLALLVFATLEITPAAAPDIGN